MITITFYDIHVCLNIKHVVGYNIQHLVKYVYQNIVRALIVITD